jgi:DNA helicase-2/ATP-dependent DNA helicase PcrA
LFLSTLELTAYVTKLKEENTTEANARINNIEELNNAMSHFEVERGDDASLQNFLEEVALVSDIDMSEPNEDQITLMTLHISKGLEYPIVFIVGLEEGLFPGIRSIESQSEEEMEEERRLCYVGMTCAEERLFMTYARNRRVWGQEQFHPPSRFLNEIPSQCVQQESAIASPSFQNRDRENQSLFSRRRQQKESDTEYFDEFPDYESDLESVTDDGSPSYKKGQRVYHPSFGTGSILTVEGQGDSTKLSVVFSDNSVKKFVAKYARLTIG